MGLTGDVWTFSRNGLPQIHTRFLSGQHLHHLLLLPFSSLWPHPILKQPVKDRLLTVSRCSERLHGALFLQEVGVGEAQEAFQIYRQDEVRQVGHGTTLGHQLIELNSPLVHGCEGSQDSSEEHPGHQEGRVMYNN